MQERNSTPNTLPDEDDIPYPLVITAAVIMSLVATIGTLGNALVIAAIAAQKKLRSVHNVFVVNLAVSDMYVTAMVIPFAVVGALDKGYFLLRHDILCEVIGASGITCCATSLASITFIAMERYVFLCHQKIYTKMFNRLTIPLMVIFIWMIAISIDSMNWGYTGWSSHGFSHEVRACTFTYEAVDIRYAVVICSIVGASYAIDCFCYLRIYMLVRRQSFTGSASIKAADKRLLKVFATICIVLSVMWAPFTVTYALTGVLNIAIPYWIHFIAGHTILSNSSVNFLIYAFSKDFRDGYKTVCTELVRWMHCATIKEGAPVVY